MENEEKSIKELNVELSEGQTSQTEVVGTSFEGNPLGKIKIKGKKVKEEKCSSCEHNKQCYSECELDFSELEESDTKELNVEKRGNNWCVVHGHPETGGPRDKPIGSIIKCFPTKKEADRMHRAIIISQMKNKKLEEAYSDLDAFELSFKKKNEIFLFNPYIIKSLNRN